MKKIFNKLFSNIKGQRLSIPEFEKSETIRAHIIFSGRVQGVGFRYSAFEIAQKLGLTGNVKNLQNGNVELEAQGEKDKVKFLIEYMDSLPFPRVENVKYEEIKVIDEDKFEII